MARPEISTNKSSKKYPPARNSRTPSKYPENTKIPDKYPKRAFLAFGGLCSGVFRVFWGIFWDPEFGPRGFFYFRYFSWILRVRPSWVSLKICPDNYSMDCVFTGFASAACNWDHCQHQGYLSRGHAPLSAQFTTELGHIQAISAALL